MRDIVTQYRIITDGSGWIERTDRGRLRFDGADRIAFLHALLTNDIAALAPGAGNYALYLTPQGRMIADLHVFVRPDHVIADVPAAVAAKLAGALDAAIFTEDVRVTDVSAVLRQISVLGGQAASVLSGLVNTPEAALKNLPIWSQISFDHGFVARADDYINGNWDVMADEAGVREAIAALERAGAVPASSAVAEAMRIEAGRPRFGIDMTEETIPLEAGLLDRAISQTKGCYVGQEVIIRVLHRGAGRVAKRLVRLATRPTVELPPADARIVVDGRDVGRVTSAVWSPRVAGPLALGYVARDVAEAGREVVLSWAGHDVPAMISGLVG
jgi:folate-binding protein YgfZ